MNEGVTIGVDAGQFGAVLDVPEPRNPARRPAIRLGEEALALYPVANEDKAPVTTVPALQLFERVPEQTKILFRRQTPNVEQERCPCAWAHALQQTTARQGRPMRR